MRSKILRGGLLLSASAVVSRVCALAASVVIARTISQGDFGVGAQLWLVATLLKMISDLGLDRMIVQAEDGDDEKLGAVAQTMILARGGCMAAALLALAYPTACWFNRPDATWAFQLVALQALVDGFVHRDIVRLQRQFRFLPTACGTVAPQVAALAAAYPLALFFGDFRVFIAIGFLRSILSVAASFCFAVHPYRLGWDRAIAHRFIAFGWPLILNGLFIYAGVQGMQLIVGGYYSAELLAMFSVAVALTWLPVSELDSILQKLALPALSACQNDRALFQQRVEQVATLTGLLAAAVACVYVLLAPFVIAVYGPKYQDAANLVMLLGAAQSTRLLRVGPSVTAVSLAFTKVVAAANFTRVSNIAVAAFLAIQGVDLVYLCLGALLIDSLAYPIAVSLLATKKNLPFSLFSFGFSAFAVTALSVGIARWRLDPAADPVATVVVAAAALSLIGVVAYSRTWKQTQRMPAATTAN